MGHPCWSILCKGFPHRCNCKQVPPPSLLSLPPSCLQICIQICISLPPPCFAYFPVHICKHRREDLEQGSSSTLQVCIGKSLCKGMSPHLCLWAWEWVVLNSPLPRACRCIGREGFLLQGISPGMPASVELWGILHRRGYVVERSPTDPSTLVCKYNQGNPQQRHYPNCCRGVHVCN